MKNKGIKLLAILFCVSFLGTGSAMGIMSNPFPTDFYDDDDTELFLYSDTVLGFKVSGVSDPTGGIFSEFGFFFGSDDPTEITNRISIFDAFDVAPPDQVAAVDFTTGLVQDEDGSVQSTFDSTKTGPIGFYYALAIPTATPPFSATLYTTTIYNSGGDVGTFAAISTPSVYLLGFELVPGEVLALEVVGALAPVPEPATVLLFGTGIIGLVAYSRKRKMKV